MTTSSKAQAKLDAEISALGPATVHVVTADEKSLAAIGPTLTPPTPRGRPWTPARPKPAGKSPRCKRYGPSRESRAA